MEKICHIKNGKILNPADIRNLFEPLKDGTYKVKVSPRKVRSLQQNSYYWGVVCDMVYEGLRDAGYDEVKTAEDAHEIMKLLFLKKDVVSTSTGEILAGATSTTELTTLEFAEYIEKVRMWAAEYLNINIPDPE